MVYLVDDDHDDLEIVQEALAENSYKGPVISSTNGMMLIEKLNGVAATLEHPSVIIMDLNMPLLDGFETLREIRDHPVYRSVPVIILTASSRKEDETKSFELGCNFFMRKPTRMVDYAELTAIVKHYISTTPVSD